MPVIRFNNSSFTYALAQISGLTSFGRECVHARDAGRVVLEEIDKEVNNGKIEAGSARDLFHRNFHKYAMANTPHCKTMLRKRHALYPGMNCECQGGTTATEMFKNVPLLNSFCACSSERNQDNETIELQTCYASMPAITYINKIKIEGTKFEAIDILLMGVHFSPLEFLLTLGTSLPCRKDKDLSDPEHCFHIKAYKNFIVVEGDQLYVKPDDHKLEKLEEEYDSYITCINPTSRVLLQNYGALINSNQHFSLLVLQIVHLARASFTANSQQDVAISAFLNAAFWKLHLIAVFAARLKLNRATAYRIDSEEMPLDDAGAIMIVSLEGMSLQITSELAETEDWFKICKLLLEHLFHRQLNIPRLSEENKWLGKLSIFAFSNASCALQDTRCILYFYDILAALKLGRLKKSAWAFKAVGQNPFLHDFVPSQPHQNDDDLSSLPSSSDEETNEQASARTSHLATTHECLSAPRTDERWNTYILSSQKGWTWTLPQTNTIKINIHHMFKGHLSIQNRRFVFQQTGTRNIQEHLPRPLCTSQSSLVGLFENDPEKDDTTGDAVARLALAGRASLKAGRWVLRQLVNNSVMLARKKPTVMQHIGGEEEGADMDVIIGSEILQGIEVARTDSAVYIPGYEIVPDYELFLSDDQRVAFVREYTRSEKVLSYSNVKLAPLLV